MPWIFTSFTSLEKSRKLLKPVQPILRHLEPIRLFFQEDMKTRPRDLPLPLLSPIDFSFVPITLPVDMFRIRVIQRPSGNPDDIRKRRIRHAKTRAALGTETAGCNGTGRPICRRVSEISHLRRVEMGPCLVRRAGLFATLDAVAVDQPRWRLRGCVADEATGTASSRHCSSYSRDV